MYLSLNACSSLPIAYITNQGSNTVSVVDIKNRKITHEIPVGNGPVGVAISLKQNYGFITNANDGSVDVLDLYQNKIVKKL